MSSTPPRTRIRDAATVLQQAGYADVAKFLLARDKKKAHKKRPDKPVKADVARYGSKVRGGTSYVNMHNEQIEYVELIAEDEAHLARASKKAKALFKRGEVGK